MGACVPVAPAVSPALRDVRPCCSCAYVIMVYGELRGGGVAVAFASRMFIARPETLPGV
jgi:hypothetical protein